MGRLFPHLRFTSAKPKKNYLVQETRKRKVALKRKREKNQAKSTCLVKQETFRKKM